mgnify:CR=1 FL=1
MPKLPSVEELAAGVKLADRASLGRAISLVESEHPAHRQLAEDLLNALSDVSSNCWRIGVTGVPGAGKSTFLEQLGLYITRERKEKVAVLAVDPSSPISGGSILGDKTRMNDLAREERAFIRPSPSGGSLGGIAKRSYETLRICEAAGFDYCFIETVGVGQSEALVKKLSDVMLLLLITGAGDQLQGIKRGIMELADIILINKADGDNAIPAKRALAEIRQAVQLLPDPEHGKPVVSDMCSSLSASGMENVWKHLFTFFQYTQASGWKEQNRRSQTHFWIRSNLEDALLHELRTWLKKDEKALALMSQSNQISPFSLSMKLLELFEKRDQQQFL